MPGRLVHEVLPRLVDRLEADAQFRAPASRNDSGKQETPEGERNRCCRYWRLGCRRFKAREHHGTKQGQ
jgi:hypothetical protein